MSILTLELCPRCKLYSRVQLQNTKVCKDRIASNQGVKIGIGLIKKLEKFYLLGLIKELKCSNSLVLVIWSDGNL